MKQRLIFIMFLALAAITANAQDDFDPALPGEPNALYKVSVGISHADAGTVNGGGSYATGRELTISRNDAYFSTSSTVFYRFKYWTLNGVEYTSAGQSSSFTYTVETQNAAFEAVYEVEDPDNVTSRLFLVAEPADACSFNYSSGQRFMESNEVYLYYNPTSDAFIFDGWYVGEERISTNRFFYYTIGDDDDALTARFSYEPAIPGEPGSNQEDVDMGKIGDINNDGNVDTLDLKECIEVVLNGIDNKRADVSRDGRITILDIVKLVELLGTAIR